MAKRNTSTNPLFVRIRELEHEALAAGIISERDIRTSQVMRQEAWTDYLIRRGEELAQAIDRYNKNLGGAQ